MKTCLRDCHWVVNSLYFNHISQKLSLSHETDTWIDERNFLVVAYCGSEQPDTETSIHLLTLKLGEGGVGEGNRARLIRNLSSFTHFENSAKLTNKAVYTTAPVAGGWAGAVMILTGAVMIWAGAVMIWAVACLNTNFSTLKMPKYAKKAKCDGRTDRLTDQLTDRPTDTVTYRSRARDKKNYQCPAHFENEHYSLHATFKSN